MNYKEIGKAISKNKLIMWLEKIIGALVVDCITLRSDTLYIFSYGGIGDTIAIVSLSGYLKNTYKFSRMILVCKKNHRDVSDFFEYFDGVMVLNRVFMYFVRVCNQDAKRTYGKNYIIGNCRLLFRTWHDYENRLDAFKVCVLQIPCSAKPQNVRIKVESIRQNFTDKDIIIAPHANTFKTLNEDEWIKIAEALHENGYNVFTNLAYNEKPIKGTRPLMMELKEIVKAAEKCKAVITYRSGFSDLLALNHNINHIVIYPDDKTRIYEDIGIYGSKKIISLVEEKCNDHAAEILKCIKSI